MGRSKELFEYLRQSGMYSKDSPEAEEERSRVDHELDEADVEARADANSGSRGPRGREHDVARAMVEQLANRSRNETAVSAEDEPIDDPVAGEPSSEVALDADEAPAPTARRSERKKTSPKRRDRRGERPATRRIRESSAGAKARRSSTTDESEDSVSSFGDQTFSFSYNNAALTLLFFASLTVLSYFLGFTQGMGDPVQRTPAAYMGEFPIGANQDRSASDPRSLEAQGLHERGAGSPAGAPTDGGVGAGAPESHVDGPGFLEGNRVFHSICVFQADARNGAIAMQHLRDLQNAGYDAWTSTDERGFHRVWVGRYEEKSQELHDLLAELKSKELQSGGELDQAYHDAYISQVTPGP